VAFLDESGTISSDRFFAVGLLKHREPSELLREVQRFRDTHRFYDEFHWKELSLRTFPYYEGALGLVAASSAEFSCFVVDRQQDDPVARFGSTWKAYEKLACQLLHGNIKRRELVTVLADNYSTPPNVFFEKDVKRDVNGRFDRLAVTNVCRLDSRSTDGLQLVDLLLGAVLFEFKAAVGLAKTTSKKANLSARARALYGVTSFRPSVVVPRRLNVAMYSSHQGP
jgi:hypothetical protein